MSVFSPEFYGFPVRDEATLRAVNKRPNLREAPAKAALGVVGDIPQEFDHAVSSVRLAVGDKIGKESPRFFGRGKFDTSRSATNLQGAEEMNVQRKGTRHRRHKPMGSCPISSNVSTLFIRS